MKILKYFKTPSFNIQATEIFKTRLKYKKLEEEAIHTSQQLPLPRLLT